MHSNRLALASLLLDKAADELSRNGCNDFTLPNTPENVELLNDMEQDNVGPGRVPEQVHVFDARRKELYTSDWWLARFLGKSLQKEIDMAKGNKNKGPPPSAPADPAWGETLTPPDSKGYVSLDDELVATQTKLKACEGQLDLAQTKLSAAVAEADELRAELKAAKEALAQRIANEAVTAPTPDVEKLKQRVVELMDGHRLWLRDYPNQILRDKRQQPDDGSALQRSVYLVLDRNGALRGFE